MLIATD